MSKFDMDSGYHYYEEAVYGKPEYDGFNKKQLKRYGYIVRCFHLGFQDLYNYIHYSERTDLNNLLSEYEAAVDASIKALDGVLNIPNENRNRYTFRDFFMGSNDARFVKEDASLLKRVVKYRKQVNWVAHDLTQEETVKSTLSGVRSHTGTVNFFGHWLDYVLQCAMEGDVETLKPELLVDFRDKAESVVKKLINEFNFKY